MPDPVFFFRGAVTLAIGLLLGLERERTAQSESRRTFAGVRTFSLCSLTGFLAGSFDGVAVLVCGFAAVAAIVIAAYWSASDADSPGITTEAAYLLTYLLGALCARGLVVEAGSVALAATTLLAHRDRLHAFARALPERDLGAALKFGIITVIVLPLLPDRTLPDAWYGVNPCKVWLMVVLISGIGFAGYILTRFLGARAGTGLAGLVGGLVSSTAVTLTFSRRSRVSPSLSEVCAAAVLAACAVLPIRVFVEALVVHPAFARSLALPLAAVLATSLAVAAAAWLAARSAKQGDTGVVDHRNPVDLLPAVKFALLYAAVTIAFKLAQKEFGSAGVYAAAFLSGLTDMDAVTLSMAQDTRPGGAVDIRTGTAAVLTAAVSNTAVKACLALALASPACRRRVALGLGVVCAAAGAALAAVLLYRGGT